MNRTLAPVIAALALVGCAHTNEEVRTATTVDAPSEREVIAIVEPAAQEEMPRARPRLSRTVTLGQGTPDAEYTGPTAPQPKVEPPRSPTVIVNNTIVNSPPVYGYGYGYGSWGYRGYGYGRGHDAAPPSRGSWGTTGWEGASRTAAPGQTPGIGGNWPAVPSYGPAQMR